MEKLKFIGLFCGIGGFNLGLNKFECVYACDNDPKCQFVYEQNFGIKPEGDINKIDIKKIPSFDILCAGFPCQPFSKAGLKKGFNDVRGDLFFAICNIIQLHRPKYVILENVKNLVSNDNGNTWKTILENLEKLDYNTYQVPLVLNVLHFNTPQNRERIFILCKRKDLGNLLPFPTISKSPKTNLTRNINSIIDSENVDYNKKFLLSNKLQDVEKIWNNFLDILFNEKINIPKFPLWTDWWDNELDLKTDYYYKNKKCIDKNKKFYHENKKTLLSWLKCSRECKNWTGVTRKFEWHVGLSHEKPCLKKFLWSIRSSGIRVTKLQYTPTLVTSIKLIYGPESRELTPKELLRLQDFPENFKYEEKTILKQIGNAVNVKVVQKCVDFLILNEPLF